MLRYLHILCISSEKPYYAENTDEFEYNGQLLYAIENTTTLNAIALNKYRQEG